MRSGDSVLKANVAENKAQKPKSEFKKHHRLICDIAYPVSNCVALHFQHRPQHMQMHQTGINNVSGHHCKLVSHQLSFALLQLGS